MSARDELAGLLFTTDNSKSVSPWSEWERCKDDPRLAGYVYALADAILAAGYRKPLTIDNEKLVINDGLLLLDVGSCTCSPYGSSHEYHCGYEYIDDLTKPLARAGYRRPRTITTAEEANKLPDRSAILTPGQIIFHKWEDYYGEGKHAWERELGKMVPAEMLSDEGHFPATLLHEPGQP